MQVARINITPPLERGNVVLRLLITPLVPKVQQFDFKNSKSQVCLDL